MTPLDILLYPHPILRQPSRELSKQEIVSSEIQLLIHNMIETMYYYQGSVGLAAPQIGETVQLIVMDSMAKTSKDCLKVFINPVIISQSQWKYCREGCLSVPDYLVTLKRAKKTVIQWLNPEGKEEINEFSGFESIILQHEIDHLKGILFLDRIKNINTDLVCRNSIN